MRALRAFRAKHGDSLLLLSNDATVLIDGGPAGVYNQTLRAGLTELEGKDGEPPRIDLLMVSHIDADHIDGVLDLTDELLEARDEESEPIVRVERAWHNSFSDVIAHQASESSSQVKASAAGVADFLGELAGGASNGRDSRMVLSSVGQGRRLRLDLKALNIDLNQKFEHRIVTRDNAKGPWKKGDLTLTAIGPTQKEVDHLRTTWAKALPEILAKESAAEQAALELDRSVSNLASIVAIAETGGNEALLTGDARGDRILSWLEQAGRLEPGKSTHFRIVKLPHHGSDRNVSPEFFQRITADHYVVCGNGGHGNPEPRMFEMLFAARPGLDYKIHMTYGPAELEKHKAFKKAGNGPKLEAILEEDPKRREALIFPADGESHLDIAF